MFLCQPCQPDHQVEDAALEVTEDVPEVRTAKKPSMTAEEALAMLRAGNQRYIEGTPGARVKSSELRSALASQGQNPAAIIVACADSRCPTEILFDAQPGDIFVLRNAGNTCTHGEGSIVGSLEYGTGHLHTRLVLVLGHTKCGAIAGATKVMQSLNCGPEPTKSDTGRRRTALEALLQSLAPVAKEAASQLPQGATAEEIAAHAVKVNVVHTMDRILEFSPALRELVRQRKVQVHGAIYNLASGNVDFLGQSPNLGRIVDSLEPPPRFTRRYSPDDSEEELAQEQQQEQQQESKPPRRVSASRQRWYHHLSR